MDNDVAIEFDHVNKKYSRGRTVLLKEALLNLFRPNATDTFWALKDASFTIRKGESVGIIGTNGSGKSTTLKLIAGVTSPTSGKVTVSGTISPLIELGAGFHGELSGRENIYLNGTILGLTKQEIDKKMQSIIDFAEIEEFIDSPVKHYSSGMYMRLGFAIAVHVDPEILLVDEIFAVGDIGFQEKCFQKMNEFKKRKVTIVFVSHSMQTVKKFCDRTILISNGVIKYDGLSIDAVKEYAKLIRRRK